MPGCSGSRKHGATCGRSRGEGSLRRPRPRSPGTGLRINPAGESPAASDRAVNTITSAATLIAEHPLAGQRIHGEIRELVISFGATGLVALYRFLPLRQEVRILAVRHQRKLGYRP